LNIFFFLRKINPYIYIFLIHLYKKFIIFFFFVEIKKYFFLKKIKKKFEKNCKILDIGSNQGQISRLINFFFKKFLILQFDPYNNKSIIIKKNIISYNFGLGKKNEKKNIYIPFYRKFILDSYISTYKSKILSNCIRDNFNTKNIYIKKKVCTFKKLDSLKIKTFFIKIDAEGSEYDILIGSKKTIKKNNPIILLEVNTLLEFKKINTYLTKHFNYAPFFFSKNKFQRIYFRKLAKYKICGDIFFLSKKSFKYLNS